MSYQAAGISDVFLHGQARRFRVTFADGGVNSAVKHEWMLKRDTVGKLAHAHEKRAVNAFKEQMADPIAARTKDSFMEGHIGI